ncbi:Transglutaminase/protease-like ues [Mactra antiquata]
MSWVGRRTETAESSSSGRNVNPNRWISVFEEIRGRRYKLVNPEPDSISDEEKVSVSEPKEALIVKKVDLDIRKNTSDHHTDEFDITDILQFDTREMLVVRRGQKFDMKIDFNRNYNPKKDDLRLVFKFGKKPLPTLQTHQEFKLSEEDLPNKWGAYITKKGSKSINVSVMTPSTCHVGKWTLHIDVVKEENDETTAYRYVHKDPIYILFNPWCKDDQVYMADSRLLEEYILNESGKIYVGTSNCVLGEPWHFGQFDGNILDCILMLLDDSNLQDRARNDPVLVSRKLSALINSNDENGVLVGKWGKEYPGGTHPLDWICSVKILEQYYQTRRSVRYGQCWVFSGVLTTACRAIGIPARSVTNFQSAHDADGSVTIDIYETLKSKRDHFLTKDSIWNFHVWNDIWMARPDLPEGYNGWQAIDATPQETSDGIYCMGPMPIKAIKEGNVTIPYDGKFVFAEVNGDKLTYLVQSYGNILMKIEHDCVGKAMSTKRPLSSERDDVTSQYKYADGSKEGRNAVKRAKQATGDDSLYEEKPKDIIFELSDYETRPKVGVDIEVELKITNTCSEDRTVSATFVLHSIDYTSAMHKTIDEKEIINMNFASKEVKVFTIKSKCKDYLPCLIDYYKVGIKAIGIVQETKQVIHQVEDFRMSKPTLNITAPATVTVGQTFEVEVDFVNPLGKTLTECELEVAGLGLQNMGTYKQGDVLEGQMFKFTFKMTAGKPGHREIIASFKCKQISNMKGDRGIQVDQRL